MFTQCTNCQAIFNVSMREVTVSKGLLRCGECLEVFDSSKNLSTSMQEPFANVDIKDTSKLENLSSESLQTISALDDWQSKPTTQLTQNQVDLRQSPTKERKTPKKIKQQIKDIEIKASKPIEANNIKKKWPLVTAIMLASLLVFQVAFNYRHLFLDAHKYDPEKIQMLNHNVFAHPIEKNVLLISASIENTADFDQAFPILEVRLTNSKAELVALRRFSPDEYLDNYSSQTLLTKKRATSIKLKIQDPGSQATRFQFNFL